MPYQRRLNLQTSLLAWHDIAVLQAAPQWSPPYRVASPRLLLPLDGALPCEVEGRRFVCDSFSALWLTPRQAYRIRQPRARQRGTLLQLNHDAPFTLNASRAAFPLGLQLRLALWRTALRRGNADTLAVEEGLLGMLDSVLSTGSQGCGGSHRAVERARELLAAEPQARHTLAQIADAAACSPFHLAREFRRRTGSSLHTYRTGLRMALALQRLEQGERNLNLLAAELGYSSHSHFSAAFKRRLGCTPRQLRTNLTAPTLR